MNEYLFPNNQVGKGKGANNDVNIFISTVTSAIQYYNTIVQ